MAALLVAAKSTAARWSSAGAVRVVVVVARRSPRSPPWEGRCYGSLNGGKSGPPLAVGTAAPTIRSLSTSSSSTSTSGDDQDNQQQQMPLYSPPDKLTFEMAMGISDATMFYIKHGLSNQRLKSLAEQSKGEEEEETMPVVTKWQKMMEVFLATQGI